MLRKKWLGWMYCAAAFCGTQVDGSIIKKPPTKQTEVSYQNLVCTEQDQQRIYEIISTVGETGKLALAFQGHHLRSLGAQIQHVHPLKFLSTIFKNPHLKVCMRNIWDDYPHFKRDNFFEGLIPSLNRENEKGKLHIYISDFAEELGIPLETIKPYFDAEDWESLVLFLIEH